MSMHADFKPLIFAGTILGIGLGGFFDGILFHQILQLHGMLSNRYFPDTVANIEINMFWDGIFHAITWLFTVWGLSLIWKAVGKNNFVHSTKVLVGSMFYGWGLFNLLEGVIDHHVLQVHHVIQRATQPEQLYWDLLFLASGVVFLGFGHFLVVRAQRSLIVKPA